MAVEGVQVTIKLRKFCEAISVRVREVKRFQSIVDDYKIILLVYMTVNIDKNLGKSVNKSAAQPHIHPNYNYYNLHRNVNLIKTNVMI